MEPETWRMLQRAGVGFSLKAEARLRPAPPMLAWPRGDGL